MPTKPLAAGFALLALTLTLAQPAFAQQPIALKFASPAPVQSVLHGSFTAFIDAVNEAAGGTIKVEPYYGASLGNFNVMYDRVVDGVADFGFILTAQAGGKFKLHDVASLPKTVSKARSRSGTSTPRASPRPNMPTCGRCSSSCWRTAASSRAHRSRRSKT